MNNRIIRIILMILAGIIATVGLTIISINDKVTITEYGITSTEAIILSSGDNVINDIIVVGDLFNVTYTKKSTNRLLIASGVVLSLSGVVVFALVISRHLEGD